MKFEKLFKYYTVSVIVLMLVLTFVCVCLGVANKGKSNLGGVQSNSSLEICTQKSRWYC